MKAKRAEVVPATLAHAVAVAADMRDADAAEVMASGGFTPLEATTKSLETSDYARTLLISDAPAAIWGTNEIPGVPGVGAIWLLGTRALQRSPKLFLRHCGPAALTPMLERYPVLVNAVDARYTEALRWARWLGFEITPPVPFGVAGLPFHYIVKRRESNV